MQASHTESPYSFCNYATFYGLKYRWQYSYAYSLAAFANGRKAQKTFQGPKSPAASTSGRRFPSAIVRKHDQSMTYSSTSDYVDCASIDEYREHMDLSKEQLNQIAQEFQKQMSTGLAKDSNLLMIPTLVDLVPDGHETGELFGIEVGGSKLRVVFAHLSEEKFQVETVQVEESLIPQDKRHCPASELFDYIARKMMTFASGIGRDLKLCDQVVLGLCFSFPVQNESIRSGKLIKWTKGFENEGAVGKDPGDLLCEAFQRQGVSVRIGALVNDTVGILCATRYTSGPDANVAVIMGTGTNACYVEQAGNIAKWQPRWLPRTSDMVVNVEWPGFRTSAVVPWLAEDAFLDAQSSLPGDQAFEKLTAGLYMGDIARRIILRLAEREGWFEAESCSRLEDPVHFGTVQLAQIAQDETPGLDITAEVLAAIVQLDTTAISQDVRQKAKEVCWLVTKRSAQLIAAAVLGILQHLERSAQEPDGQIPCNLIAVDGGIFSQFHLYRTFVHQAVQKISGEDFASNFELVMINGGAGFGAATVAGASHKYDQMMGRVRGSPGAPRKFPPRGQSHSDLTALND